MIFTIPEGCKVVIILPNGVTHNVKEGRYDYECELTKNIYSPFSSDTPLIDIIKNKEGKKIIKELLPKIYDAITNNNEIEKYSIKSANADFKFNYSKELIKNCSEELSKINP